MSQLQTEGTCLVCNGVFSKAAMSRHSKTCRKKDAPASKSAAGTSAFRTLVEGRYAPFYWMQLEAPGQCTLADLDAFLRRIWLECCGHMSAFKIDKRNYLVAPDGMDDEADMNVRLDRVLRPKLKFSHEYDFGSSTLLSLKVLSQVESTAGTKQIQILARNLPPRIDCDNCDTPATQVCTSCGSGVWLCDACAPQHSCGEEFYLPVVNSPRVGTCGYTG